MAGPQQDVPQLADREGSERELLLPYDRVTACRPDVIESAVRVSFERTAMGAAHDVLLLLP